MADLQAFMDSPTRQDIVVKRLGNVNGFRITPDGRIFVSIVEITDSFTDGKRLYDVLAGLTVDYVEERRR